MSERQQLTSTPSRLRRFIRHFRLPALCIGGLFAVVLVVYLVENWRGARRFEQVRESWEAKGERLDWAAFIPPSVSDDSNVAVHPLLLPLSQYHRSPSRHLDSDGLARVERLRLPYEKPPRPIMPLRGTGPYVESERDQFGSAVDLRYWQLRLRQNTNFPSLATPSSPAKDVLLALMRFQAELGELHEALGRPQCRFPLRYDENPINWLMTHLSGLKGLADVLRVRSAALIEEGRTTEAVQDICDLVALADTVKNEPSIISFQVRAVIHRWGCERVLQGIEKQCWRERELRLFQTILTKQDLLADGAFAQKGEIAGRMRAIDMQSAKGSELRWLPKGWFDQNKAALVDFAYRNSLPALDLTARRVFRGQIKAAQEEQDRVQRLADTPYTLFGAGWLPRVDRPFRDAARAQTANDLTLLACAMERHRRDRGQVPEILSQLVPDFLPAIPSDVMASEPLKYRRGDAGLCAVWSVGWNERDDGGQIKRIGKRNIVVAESDWIFEWQAQP